MEEIWKNVEFDFEFTNDCRYEVSNLGRVRSFNKIANGNILKGSMTEGYRTIRLKLYKPREPEKEAVFNELKAAIKDLSNERKTLIKEKAYPPRIERITKRIDTEKKRLSKRLQNDLRRRTINHTLLVHRLVAKYFIGEPEQSNMVVGHLDYNKLNNRVDNLKWMTPEDNRAHQNKSPYVIAEKKERKYAYKYRKRKKGTKLTSTQVMHIKMLLKRGRPVRRIAKQFAISDMQVYRIKSGENWAHIKIPE